jgi:hypothetical protein
MAYWAQYIHVRPQDLSMKDQASPQYLWEPYVPGSVAGPQFPLTFGEKLSHGLHQQVLKLFTGEHAFMNIETISDMILRRMFIELDIYYHQKLHDENGNLCPARDLIRHELVSLIRKHWKKNIMIIAHSMGSIIAYDALLHDVPDIPVHTLITIGSPLGFPVIMHKIKQELGLEKGEKILLPTPHSIQNRWINLADLDDVTCLNYHLRDHYAPNRNGVQPLDEIVFNDYAYHGNRNPHKSYGYLRTANLARTIYHFLVLENAGLWQRIKWIVAPPKG